MYSETNKKIKSYRNSALQFSQKYRLVVHLVFHWNVENLRAPGSAFLSRVQGHLYVHCSKNFLIVKMYTKSKEES